MIKKRFLSMLVLLAAVVTGAVAQSYNVTVKDGTEDADKWSATPNPATAGQTVTIKYNGTKTVKSVKAVKKAPAGAEGHALSASVVGDIVGTDGKAYAVADKDNLPSGVTAVAIVAYKSATTGSSLAIALADEGEMNWSSAKSTCAGKTAIGGNSWKLPSQNEWKQMFSANGGDNTKYTGLNTAITTAGGTALQELANYYWSSTPVDDEDAWRMWLDGTANWSHGDMGNDNRVRACLAF